MINPTNQTYVRVPLSVFDQMASILRDIDFLQANITDKSSIKQKVAEAHAVILGVLGDNANLIYAEDN